MLLVLMLAGVLVSEPAEAQGRVPFLAGRLKATDLRVRTQAALALRFGEGLAVKEVAERLGDSPAAVAMRLSRALRALRERLA